jgi:hypothetical protein
MRSLTTPRKKFDAEPTNARQLAIDMYEARRMRTTQVRIHLDKPPKLIDTAPSRRSPRRGDRQTSRALPVCSDV